MARHVDEELQTLKQMILKMGAYVEKALEVACTSVLRKDAQRFELVHECERQINVCHKQIDEFCLSILARQAPVAHDLRMVIAVIKINSDLERMGDQAVNIAYIGNDLLKVGEIKNKSEFEKMAKSVQEMVKRSLDAFVQQDIQLSESVILSDDQIDRMKNNLSKELVNEIQSGGDVDANLDQILIVRNLERLADHATNIAEDVIFMATGKDIRHGGPRSEAP